MIDITGVIDIKDVIDIKYDKGTDPYHNWNYTRRVTLSIEDAHTLMKNVKNAEWIVQDLREDEHFLYGWCNENPILTVINDNEATVEWTTYYSSLQKICF